MDAPVSKSRLAVSVRFSVTGTIIDPPLRFSGTMIEPPGAFAAEVFATSTETPPASRGSARKKLSTFFDCSLSLCVIQSYLATLDFDQIPLNTAGSLGLGYGRRALAS